MAFLNEIIDFYIYMLLIYSVKNLKITFFSINLFEIHSIKSWCDLIYSKLIKI